MKIAPSITISITRPRKASPVISYLDLLLVVELDAGARGKDALDRLRNALDQKKQAGERHHHLEGPQDRPPRRLLRGLADREGVPAFVPADDEEHEDRRKEEHQIRNRVD